MFTIKWRCWLIRSSQTYILFEVNAFLKFPSVTHRALTTKLASSSNNLSSCLCVQVQASICVSGRLFTAEVSSINLLALADKISHCQVDIRSWLLDHFSPKMTDFQVINECKLTPYVETEWLTSGGWGLSKW